MEELRAKFLEEARELMGKLEAALLELEANPNDKERIDEVFRVMHTLKGSGGMFGFNALSEHTHDLESVYDLVRSSKLPLTRELIDVTFRSMDLIGKLLESPEDPSILKLKDDFAENIKERFLNHPVGAPDTRSDFTVRQKDDNTSKVTYHIHFQPGEGVLKDGTHPLYLLDELLDLGTGKAFVHMDKLPEFESLVPDLAYFYWDFLLATAEAESDIKDVFIFVEDNSVVEINKIAEEDLLQNEFFNAEIENLKLEETFTRDKLDRLVEVLQNKKPAEPEETTNEEKMPPPQAERPQVGELNSIRVSSAKLDNMMDLVSELITAQARLEHMGRKLKSSELQRVAEDFEKLFRQLRSNTLEMRLIPIYTLLARFKRMVRDLSHDLNKQVRFQTTGTETELDKSVIEMLYDPLMHIIRNSLDHGIELPDERVKLGKQPEGLIEIVTYYSGSYVVIEVRDNGQGMDPEAIRQKALEKNLISASDKLDHDELLNLVFHPGFSTSKQVSQLSGRGVGMDVVRKNITELRGYVELNSIKGKGTTVRIRLPLTLSIIDGLLVLIGNARYLVPLENIVHIYPLEKKELEKAGFSGAVVKEGNQIQFVHLIHEFGDTRFVFEKGYLLVFRFENKEIGFVINEIEGKHQAVIKPLNQFVKGKELFSGATVLGDGKVALVVDPYRMMQQYTNTLQ
ncbi:MAG: chemotaxis protein CheA [Bacteroidales bacterium]|nr:chemotaxis protein CheA [Bacteroidales bacterium]